MSSHRTKSFFDQDHRAKSRPGNWNNRYNDKGVLREASTNTPAAPKPPIPPTSQAKSKLKAFQFVPGRPEESTRDSGEKENMRRAQESRSKAAEGNGIEASKTVTTQAPASAPTNASSASKRPGAEPTTTSSSSKPFAHHSAPSGRTTPQLPHGHTFPCTPATRLPLEDLIGNIDEEVKKPEQPDQSPQEQIGWIPNSSSTLLTPHRKRKRARSSSPVSSCPHTSSQQRKENSAYLAGDAALQTENNKTPEADPAADLWLQYAAGKQSADGVRLPDLSHLIFQASPRPLETPVKSAGLRRWASTGNEWPSSKAKRRRTNGRTSIGVWHDGQENAPPSGKSKVAAMVEKLQESLASQKLVAESLAAQKAAIGEAPSSSNPLPEGANASPARLTMQSRSPPRAKKLPALEHGSKLTAQRPATSHEPIHPPSDHGQTTTHNIQQMQSLDNPVRPAPLHLGSKAPLPAFKRPSITRTASGSGRQYPAAKPPSPKSAPAKANEDLDEFGDDLDFSVEDLEELMTVPLHAQPLYRIPQHPNPPPQEPIVLEDDDETMAELIANEPKPAAQGFDGADDDEFGCDIDEDSFAQAEFSATQAYKKSPNKRTSRNFKTNQKLDGSKDAPSASPLVKNGLDSLFRYKVKHVVEGEYTNAKGRNSAEKLLMVEDERTYRPFAITLRDSWAQTTVNRGNIVNIAHARQPTTPSLLEPTPAGQTILTDDDASPLLIVHPDHMLSATTVADSFDCIRKAVLQDRIKATGETSKAMVYGKVLHEIFQQALMANQWDEAFLADLVIRTVQVHVEALWELGMKDTVLAVEEVTAKMGELAAWASIFVAPAPAPNAVVDDSNRNGDKVRMSVSKLIAIEEHVWSPRFGLKGNIDATVQSTVHSGEFGFQGGRDRARRLVTPFEVKTGRTTQSPSHRSQTALYTLLLSDRYDVDVEAGILYYLESSTMSRIAPPAREIRQMMQQRNRLAAYIFRARNPRSGIDSGEEDEFGQDPQSTPLQSQEIEDSGLPGLLRNAFKCGRCYAQQSCFTYHALVENGTADSSGMIDDNKKNHSMVWHEAVGHLAASKTGPSEHLKRWFTKWDRLLTFEESEMSRFRRELWTMTSSEREAAGRCFGDLIVKHDLTSTAATHTSPQVDGIEGSGGKINRYAYTFCRPTSDSSRSFMDATQLTVGEPVVVSSESGQWALANGYVVGATKYDITVAVDRKLGDARQRLDGFEAKENQSLRGIMTVGKEDDKGRSTNELRYRLDKDEFANGLALVRNNLVTLMSSHPIHTKLREQVINSAAPKFAASSSGRAALPPSQLGEMNEDQRAAVSKVLSAEDYALILGMPGTGKTTTIAHIIRALLAEGKSVLLTSFTHTAVDNILLKVRDIAPPNSILRLGVPAKINQEVQTFCQLAATPRKSIDEIEAAYMGSKIVATTCMGTNHALFNRRAFDVCIVDEASQITLPTALGPLLHARKFVLVGDHYQLPPLVQNRAALEGGLDMSLFRQLSEQHPEAVATLGRQYRMCEDIMSLSNELIYNGQLCCGNEAVAQRTLELANPSVIRTFHTATSPCTEKPAVCWLAEATRPERKVVFANTDALGSRANETLTTGKNITNTLEATLSAQLVLALIAQGVPPSSIGVMTLYRSQLALLRRLFASAGLPKAVEIDSADRFQGRDKEVIVLSLVRANENGIVGDLLKDWRRVNVALTRARSKLIVLGHQRTLRSNDLLARFLALVERRGWVLGLPEGADEMHAFDSWAGSQLSAAAANLDMLQTKVTASPRLSQKSLSPTKKPSQAKHIPSPTKRVLEPSASAGNRRSPNKNSSGKGVKSPMKIPAKNITGRRPPSGFSSSAKARAAKELIVADIFEDLTGDEF